MPRKRDSIAVKFFELYEAAHEDLHQHFMETLRAIDRKRKKRGLAEKPTTKDIIAAVSGPHAVPEHGMFAGKEQTK